MTMLERFLAKIDKNGELHPYEPKLGRCWMWLGATASRGLYGQIRINRLKIESSHRISWQLFRKRKIGDLCVLHSCDRGLCVNPKHLFLGTHLDNARDKYQKGRGNHARGERNGESRLTEADVKMIRLLYATGVAVQVELAEKFGVSQVMISKIVRREFWRHVA